MFYGVMSSVKWHKVGYSVTNNDICYSLLDTYQDIFTSWYLFHFWVFLFIYENLKKKKKKKKTEKKKHVKYVTQSNQLVHFCLMMSGAFCTDEPGRVGQLWEDLLE